MNGLYLRALDVDAYADALVTYLREQGIDWDEARIRAAAPIVQEKIGRLGEFPDFAGFLFEEVEPDPALLDARDPDRGRGASSSRVEPWDAATLEDGAEGALRAPRAKPKTVYLPIRVAVTGSRISPGLYESLELLGRDVVARTAAPRRRARRVSAALDASSRSSRLTSANNASRRGVSLVEGARGRRAGPRSRAEGLTSGWAVRIRDT